MQTILVYFDFPSGNTVQYENAWKDLIAAGQEHPKGLLSHVGATKPGGGLIVVDVWESEEAFTEFGKVLMPIIQKNDFPMVQPKIYPVQKIVEGVSTTA